ncbi:MAG: tetratricopeptide repeat protein [Halieaceae bacterium]|jgi:TolB-like protein/Flp pilus assembly protein TadD|nr:tetratricopeptide repeat protein [Halieaceae bacterium]
MQAFIAELKRRKVFRVAVAYCTAAWALLQVADVVLSLLGLPDQAMRVMLYGIVLCFPVAVTMAWAFDVTIESDSAKAADVAPEPDRSTVRRYNLQFLLTCALVGLIGFLYYERLFKVDAAPSETATTAAAQSIAVLPFVNMSTDPANRYFSDGVSEELLNVLANVPGLRVAARTSSFRFRGGDESATEIGAKLGVSTLLEGSVRRTDRAIRVTAQLIETSTGYHLWSETYDGEPGDIFALQDRIAQAVVGTIKPLLLNSGLPPGPATQSFDAYDIYLQGRARLNEPWSDAAVSEAIDLFERATALDPGFADAYAGICDARLAEYTHKHSPDAFALAESACLRAIARAGASEPGWDLNVALSVLYREAGEFDKSLDVLALAEAAAPGRPRTLREMGMTHAAAGRFALAEDHLQRAVDLDHSDWDSYLVLANFYFETSRYDDALSAYDKVLAMVPDLPSALIGKGSTLYMQGEEALAESAWLDAIKAARDSDGGSAGVAYTNLGLLHYYRGAYEEALKMQQRAVDYFDKDHSVWGRIAETYRMLGDTTQERDSYAEAIRLAQEDVRRNPQDWEVLGLLGLYHGHLGHQEEALEYLQRMLAIRAAPPTSHYFAALIHWSLGNTEAAYDQISAARRAGFSAQLLDKDPDLQSLKALDSARWNELLAKDRSP